MPIQRTRREQLCIAFNDIAFFHYYPCSLFFCIICCCSILNDYGYVQISTASASFLFLNYHNVPKCLTIHIPQETEISIHYNFPGKHEKFKKKIRQSYRFHFYDEINRSSPASFMTKCLHRFSPFGNGSIRD